MEKSMTKREEEKLEAVKNGEPVDIGSERKEAMQAYHAEEHIKGGSYIREFILGFNDGLVSIFSLVTGVVGAAVSNKIVILAGVAGLAAGATSMGLNNYISSKSQTEFYKSEVERERKEIENVPKREREEIVAVYKLKGFEGKLLKQVVDKITSDKKRWLKVMMEEELGLFGDDFENPYKIALITGISFIFGALIPIAPYLFISNISSGLIYSAIASILGLFIVGSAKTMITKKNWLKSGAEMVMVGVLAAAASYSIGSLFSVK